MFVQLKIGIFQQMEWTSVIKQIGAALISAFLVSPSNAIFDKSVIEYANGKATVSQGVKDGFYKLIHTPLSFIVSLKFRWMFFAYGSIYTANNLSDRNQWTEAVSLPVQNLMATFAANVICGIPKDTAYAKYYGISHPKPFTIASLCCFFMRDIITLASAFTFPPIIAKKIEGIWGCSQHSSRVIGQLLCPLLVQLVVSPLHLLGLDIYNSKGATIRSRALKVWAQYPKTASMRMIRFLPAYGVGGVVNTQLRKALRE